MNVRDNFGVFIKASNKNEVEVAIKGFL